MVIHFVSVCVCVAFLATAAAGWGKDSGIAWTTWERHEYTITKINNVQYSKAPLPQATLLEKHGNKTVWLLLLFPPKPYPPPDH